METSKKDDSCQELKNIKYKTMLMNGGKIDKDIPVSSSDIDKLDLFLQNDIITIQNEPWTKLDKTVKTRKIIEYVSFYSEENNMTEEESQELTIFLKECINKKRIHRVKDVVYDKTAGKIKNIPGLSYVKSTKKYTLKNTDKRVSTLKNLPPQKSTQMKDSIIEEGSGCS